jgi:hypothetical protein
MSGSQLQGNTRAAKGLQMNSLDVQMLDHSFNDDALLESKDISV